MAIGELVYFRLLIDPAIGALVNDRIYPGLLPQPSTPGHDPVKLPALSYQRVSNSPTIGSTPLRRARYQIDCWGDTYAAADGLANLVKVHFEDAAWQSVKQATVIGQQDDPDPDTGMFRAIVDVMLVTVDD